MSKLKLIYFDIDGARGEAARLAMVIGGVPFEDDRVKFADWESRKPSTPFGALPVLELDGQTVAQSNGINRYVGKLAGLYPSDAWQAALCDEAMDAVEEIATRVGAPCACRRPRRRRNAKVWPQGRFPTPSTACSAVSSRMAASISPTAGSPSRTSRSSSGSAI